MMRFVLIALVLTACAPEPPQTEIELVRPSPEASEGISHRFCEEPNTRLDSYITEEGHVQGRCVPEDEG